MDIHEPFSNEEIKQALLDMDPFKSPSPNGFYVGFFKRMWSILDGSIINFAKKLFENGCLSESVNDKFLVLIPKV